MYPVSHDPADLPTERRLLHPLPDLLLGQKVGVLLEGGGSELVLLPEIRLEVPVRVPERVEERLDEVPHRAGVPAGGGVAVVDARHAQQALAGGGRDESGAAGRRDEADADRAALAGDLGRDGVGEAALAPPVSAADGGDVELRREDGAADGGGDLRRALVPQADVAVGVPHGHEGLEPRALPGGALLLHRHDLHDLVLELVLEEVIDDLGLLHGDGEEEYLLDGPDLPLLHETSELGDGDPDVLVASSLASAASAASASAAAIAVSTATASAAASSSETSSFVRHDYLFS